MHIKTFLRILLFWLVPLLAISQSKDTVVPLSDSINIKDTVFYAEEASKAHIYHATPDSSRILVRRFNEEELNKLKNDSDLDYKQTPTVAESLWNRFLRWLDDILGSIIENAVTTDWGRIIVYVLGLALLVVIIMTILRVNAFRILYSAEGSKTGYEVLDENIHEMDFEKLIQEAMDQQDYRKGIRLVFLYALKLLSDKQLIHFQPGKTNRDYIHELTEKELKAGLQDISFYFDYAWYGNFTITNDTFKKVQEIFSTWKGKLN